MRLDSIKLNKPLDEVLRGRIEPYAFEVGIIKNAYHKKAVEGKKGRKPATKMLAGDKARRVTGKIDGTLAIISKKARMNTGINYLTQPFKKKTDDAVKMLRTFFQLAFGQNKLSSKKRLENLLQAIVRNPMVRKEYGRNSRKTIQKKGFNRKFIDTGQLFNGITARVRVNSKGTK